MRIYYRFTGFQDFRRHTAITQLGIRPKQYLGASSPVGIERRDKFIFCEILSQNPQVLGLYILFNIQIIYWMKRD